MWACGERGDACVREGGSMAMWWTGGGGGGGGGGGHVVDRGMHVVDRGMHVVDRGDACAHVVDGGRMCACGGGMHVWGCAMCMRWMYKGGCMCA